MRIALIAALDRNGLIGRGNALPWHLPADMRRFKSLTMGKAVIMGRKTYESIGQPLVGRFNILLTRQAGYEAPGCFVARNKTAALAAAAAHVASAQGQAAGDSGDERDEVMVIGGAGVYQLFLAEAQRLYLTRVEGEFTGDTYFPAVVAAHWRLMGEETVEPDARNAYRLRFLTLERIGRR